MRIGILIDRLNVGGVEKIAIEQVKGLRAIGVDATLVVLSKKGLVDNAFLDLRKNVPTLYLDERLPKPLRFTFKFPVFSFFSFFHLSYPFLIPFVIKNKEFDYIISHGTYTSFTAIGIKKLRKISFASFIWDPISYILGRVYRKNFPQVIFSFLQILAKQLDLFIITNSDVILVGGKAHNRFFKQTSPSKRIFIIPPSTYPLTKILKNKQHYVLMVTAWKKGKNPEYIAEICRNIPSIKIKMAGKWLDSLYRKEFEKFIKDKNLSKNIEILGALPEKKLSYLYENATVLLQTNNDKGFGMPALEAAACGTTFIIPQGQGVCELFTNTLEGFFTRERDTITIVRYLKLLLHSKNKAKSMGKLAWQKVKDNYSWEIHARQLTSIIVKYAKE